MKKHMKKRVMSLFMTVVMVISLIPAMTIGASATTQEINDLADSKYGSGAELTTGIYYLSRNKTFGSSTSGTNGLKIKDGATVTILLPQGVMLTAIGKDGEDGHSGGDGTGWSGNFQDGNWYSRSNVGGTGGDGGYAGIYLPANATLIVLGEGTLNAQGGAAGNGGAGGKGGGSVVNDDKSGIIHN